MGTGAIGDVVVDAHGERVRFLEHHAHPLPQQVHVHIAVDVLAVQTNVTSDLAALHQIVHPVQGLQQRRLAAAGGADKGTDLMFRQFQIDIFQGMERVVVQVHVVNRKFCHSCFSPHKMWVGGFFH